MGNSQWVALFIDLVLGNFRRLLSSSFMGYTLYYGWNVPAEIVVDFESTVLCFYNSMNRNIFVSYCTFVWKKKLTFFCKFSIYFKIFEEKPSYSKQKQKKNRMKIFGVSEGILFNGPPDPFFFLMFTVKLRLWQTCLKHIIFYYNLL